MRFQEWITSLFKSEAENTKNKLIAGSLKPLEIDGVKFFLRRLSASYIIDLQKRNKQNALTEENFFEMLSKSVCDKKGNLVFTVEDSKQLDIFVLNTLITEMMSYNALNKDSVERAKEELKNLKPKS